jgi:hypothetical protein
MACKEFTRSIPKAGFDRIEPVVEEMLVVSISDCCRQGVVLWFVMA